MEQNRKPRNEPTTIWSVNFVQSRKEYPMEKRQSLQQIVLGKLDSNMQKNETRSLSYTFFVIGFLCCVKAFYYGVIPIVYVCFCLWSEEIYP